MRRVPVFASRSGLLRRAGVFRDERLDVFDESFAVDALALQLGERHEAQGSRLAERRVLHGAVAAWHERDDGLDDGTRFTLLAHHFGEGLFEVRRLLENMAGPAGSGTGGSAGPGTGGGSGGGAGGGSRGPKSHSDN